MISAAGWCVVRATALAVKAGVDARTFIDTVNASTGRHTATADKFPASILTRSFDYGGKLGTMYKDVSLCSKRPRSQGADVARSQVVQMWFQGMAEGRCDDDYTSLIKVIEKWADVVVGGNESGPARRRDDREAHHRLDGKGPHVLLCTRSASTDVPRCGRSRVGA